MGAVLRVHYFDNSSDEVHLACEHGPSYWTWFVSEDGHWLIVKRFEQGMERTQIPMGNIKALVVQQCQFMPVEPRSERACKCGEVEVPPGTTAFRTGGRTHRLATGSVDCDEPLETTGG